MLLVYVVLIPLVLIASLVAFATFNKKKFISVMFYWAIEKPALIRPLLRLKQQRDRKTPLRMLKSESVRRLRRALNVGLIEPYKADPAMLVTNTTLSVPTDYTAPNNGNKFDLPVRIYTPTELESATTPVPVVIYNHGGGFFFGNIETHHHICRRIAKDNRCIVVVSDYRLSPEYSYPTPIEDCYQVLKNIKTLVPRADTSRIVIAGESAGGNIATVLCIMARDRKLDIGIKYQALIYPMVHYEKVLSMPSFHPDDSGEGFVISADAVRMGWEAYLYGMKGANPEEYDALAAAFAVNPYVSPLQLQDTTGLPPVYIATTQYDVLRSEGEAYAEKLKAAGIPVIHRKFMGQTHGFFNAPHRNVASEQIYVDLKRELTTVFKA